MSKCPFAMFHSNKNRLEEDKPSLIEDYDGSPFLRIRRIHPTQGAKIFPANRHLRGPNGECETEGWPRADAVKRCGPYVHANSMGWWIFPGVDMDVTYHGDNNWEVHEYTTFDAEAEKDFYKTLPSYEYKTVDGEVKTFEHQNRGHVNAGLADKNILQIWTGMIFRTPPGWGLLIRSPINAEESYDRPYHIQEGVIESDWMDYDIWTNLVFTRVHEKVQIRRDMWPPLAQIIPVRRESYEEKWAVDDRLMSADDPEWASWQDYNYKKWQRQNEKDGKTYYKERAIQKPQSDPAKVLKIREKYRNERNNHAIQKPQENVEFRKETNNED